MIFFLIRKKTEYIQKKSHQSGNSKEVQGNKSGPKRTPEQVKETKPAPKAHPETINKEPVQKWTAPRIFPHK